MTDSGLMRTDLGGGDVELSDPSKLPPAPLISVWMITYNHASYIREALDSVLMQKVNFPYEICLGEDGSTDGTREICVEYAKKHPDVMRLFLRDRRNPARGKYKIPFRHNTVETWNACRGKYIAMLEGDDYWISQKKLQRQVDFMEANPHIALCGHEALSLREGQPSLGKIVPLNAKPVFTLEEILSRRLHAAHTSAMVLRRRASFPWAMFSAAAFGDLPLFVWHLQYGDGAVLPEIMSVYRINAGGMFGHLARLARARLNVELWQLLSEVLPEKLKTPTQIGLARALHVLIAEHRHNGELSAASARAAEALRIVLNLGGTPLRTKVRLALATARSMALPRAVPSGDPRGRRARGRMGG